MLCAVQFSARIYHFLMDTAGISAADTKRVVIIGAGDAGVSVLRELLETPRTGIVPVALVDDDPMKRGTLICGVPVVGGLPNLAVVLSEFQASEVLICVPSATPGQRKRIFAACRMCGVPVRTLPGVVSLLNNRASMRDLRAITIEDALQREQFVPDHKLTSQLVAGKVVLVTGAGGSIGSELCRQIASASPRRLILVDKSENSLFYCHMGIQEACPGLEIVPVLGDVTDEHFVRVTMLQQRPDLVFHAAAFKHVGMMELHPDQAIRNNVLGTRNVLLAATDAGVEIFVNVSTDKAVNPRCYMGLSKKLAELFVKESDARHRTRCMSVRFGNVAGSTGSVLRIFLEQIRQGKPLHVTDPHATRYFMSIPEAVFLIVCAASLGKGGETFIFDMGEPVNIYELARTLMLFAGVMPGEELPIHFTGLKDGEKVAEELWEDWEVPESTGNSRIFKLAGTNPLSIDIFAAVGRFREFIAAHDNAGLAEYIGELVPGFTYQRASIAEFALNQGQDDLERAHV
jgi:FlaA1/EpsC-like NDP-sugar epimerase